MPDYRTAAHAFRDAPSKWPIEDEDIFDALRQAYADGSWGRYDGPHAQRLIDALVEVHGVEHVALVCSGTFAVELALRSVGVSAGDEVILAGYDFPGNFRAITTLGARPVLVDVAAGNWNLDHQRIVEAISPATRALIVSHLHGGMVDMRRVVEIAERHRLAVIEDACQATGAMVQGRPAGTWGDVGVLSFGGSKLLTAGRGGAILSRRADVMQRAKVYCEQGNHAYPLSELQAAVLVPQVGKLRERNQRRHASVTRLLAQLAGVTCLRPLDNGALDCRPSHYKLGLKFDAEQMPQVGRDEIIAAMQRQGVPLDAGFRGFALRSASRCRKVGPLANVQHASACMLVLHHPILLEPQEVISQLAAVMESVVHDLGAKSAALSDRQSE